MKCTACLTESMLAFSVSVFVSYIAILHKAASEVVFCSLPQK